MTVPPVANGSIKLSIDLVVYVNAQDLINHDTVVV